MSFIGKMFGGKNKGEEKMLALQQENLAEQKRYNATIESQQAEQLKRTQERESLLDEQAKSQREIEAARRRSALARTGGRRRDLASGIGTGLDDKDTLGAPGTLGG